MKIVIILYFIFTINSQPRRTFEESLDLFFRYCSPMDYPYKLKLINAKKAVTSDEETYKKVEGERFMFIGGGGYSRVFLDDETNSVVKLIRARKLQRKSSLVSMAIELEMGFFYRIVEGGKGTVKSCEYYLKRVGDRLDMLAFHLDFLEGEDMNDYHYNKKKRKRNPFKRGIFTIQNVLHLLYSYNRLGFMHRDIKPENIFFLTERKKRNIDRVKPILIDLSFTTKEKHSKRYKGTESYMPKEMLVGDKKSDWYNQTVDVYNLGVSFIEFIIYYLNKKVIDFSFISFIEGMLRENWCKKYEEGDNFVFCDNDAIYYEKFNSLQNLADFFYKRKQIHCKNGNNSVLDNTVKCFALDKAQKNIIFECRPTMTEAKHFLDYYLRWRNNENHIYNPYRNFFYNNSGFMKYKKFVDPGFIGYMYRNTFPNTYEIFETRVNF